jgi:hypothetical protein
MPMCSGCISRAWTYPTYIHNEMQTEVPNSQDWFSSVNGSWIPNWNSPYYIARWTALMNALATHINGGSHSGVLYKNVIGYVDVRGYGETGEWNTYPWYGTEPTGRTVTTASQQSIINAVGTAFPNNQLVISFGSLDPGNASLTPSATSAYVLAYTNTWGHIGWRRDNLGDPGFDGAEDGNAGILTQWKFGPTGGEPNNDATDAPYGDLPREMTKYHMSYFGNGNWSSVNASNPTFVANARQAALNNGYRLTLHGGSITNGPVAGGPFNVTLNWMNLGVAPTYYPWTVQYILKTTTGTIVWTGNSAFSTKYFLNQATDSVVSDNFTLSGVTAGTYNLFVMLKDPLNYRKPAPMAITGIQADGSYTLLAGLVVTSSGVPTANAGTNQTIVDPPTTSVTLDGTGSTGSISSYSWTRISGPNTPTITTPTTVTTTVTGLVTGVYVFQLAINGGTSTSQVTITVNPPPVVANAGNNQTITLPTNSVTLDGSGSTGATTYSWTRISGPNTPTITTPTTVSTTVTGLIAGTYVFQLSINSGASTSQVTITVNPIPPPVANAGPDQTIFLPSTSVTLTGTASTGTITSQAWTLVGGPNTPTITSPSNLTTTVTGLIQGVYAFQLALNGGVSSDQVNITVNAAPVGVNIFTSQVPTTANQNDGLAIELGVKFRASVAGYVKGIRFYKLTANNGTHIGELYSRTGTRLAAVTFTGETTSGWQQQLFTTAVAIPANTTFVASYFSPNGNYVEGVGGTGGFLSAITNPPLTGLADGTDGFNGVYNYSATPIFPTLTDGGQQPNYWVDLIFAANVAPIARITGPNTVTFPGTSVTLDGSTSGDPDGSIVSYSWTLSSGPNSPTFVNPLSATTAITGLVPGTYVFQLQVQDNLGGIGTSTQTVVVTRGPSHFPIGSGSGTIVQNGMGTFIPGDTLQIVAGTYTSYTFKNLNHLRIVPQTTRPVFTGQNTLCNIKYDTITGGISYISSGGATAIDATCGTIDSSLIQDSYFQGFTGPVINQSGGTPYIYGVDSTYKWYNVVIDSATFFHCGIWVQGSFGTQPITNVDIDRQVVLSRIVETGSTSTSFEGIGYSGVCFHCKADSIVSTSTTFRGASGDDGMISGAGWWDLHNIYRSGTPGYMMRVFPMMEYRDQGIFLFYNNVKLNGTEYGMVNLQFYSSDSVANQRTGTGMQAWGNTMGNQFNDTAGYWSTMFNLGDQAPNTHYFVKNNFAFNVGQNLQMAGKGPNGGKPFIAYNLGGILGWNTLGGDTSNNLYIPYATQAKLDSTTVGFTNSLGNFTYYKTTGTSPTALFHTGITNPLTGTDYFGQPMRVPPDLGYYQFYGVLPPPPSCNCLIRSNKQPNFIPPH